MAGVNMTVTNYTAGNTGAFMQMVDMQCLKDYYFKWV
jgi:hypothetical protein